MMSTLKVLGVALGATLAGVGCTGAIDGASRSGGGSTTGPSTSDPNGAGTPNPGIVDPSHPTNPGITGGGSGDTSKGQLDDSKTVPGPALLRRLTIFEYQNTVRDLLGITPDISGIKDSSDQDSGLSGYVRGGVVSTADDARNFQTVADGMADQIQSKLGNVLPCTPVPTAAADQDACVDTFIAKFGLRAFRRPVAQGEADNLKTLYKTLRGSDVGASFEHAVSVMVSAMLQSPHFLYHWELGPNAPIKEGDVVRFNSYEMASRLSYMLWGTMPDDALFTAAGKGELASPEQIGDQAKRMLADAKSTDALADFHVQWLGVQGVDEMPKNPMTYTDFSKDVGKAMIAENREFIKSVFTAPGATGKIDQLLTSNHGFANAQLAKIYGVTATGNDLSPVTFDPTQRAGILTQGSFLTTKADADDDHPVKRGETILRRLLCTELSPPPGQLIPPVADDMGDKTTRKRFEEHRQGACAACHALIDPLGFAFEEYDAIGRFRTMDNGIAVDSTGTYKIGGTDVSFKNAVELAQALAKAPEVKDCMVKQWLRYSLRRMETQGETPSLDALSATFKQKDFDLRELVVAVTKSRAFTHRTLSDGEAQ